LFFREIIKYYIILTILTIFVSRYNDKCVITCSENYENQTNEEGTGYYCAPKQCHDRTPSTDNLCTLVEDDNNTLCWYYTGEVEQLKSCTDSVHCPKDYIPVC
jgi:hypothetical protein